MPQSALTGKHCKPCEGGTPPLTQTQIEEMLSQVPGWTFDGKEITRTFQFKNYYETVSFVNAAAWVAHREDHHPNMTFGYKTCKINFSTHSIKGISENDFIAAAKINALAGDKQ